MSSLLYTKLKILIIYYILLRATTNRKSVAAASMSMNTMMATKHTTLHVVDGFRMDAISCRAYTISVGTTHCNHDFSLDPIDALPLADTLP